MKVDALANIQISERTEKWINAWVEVGSYARELREAMKTTIAALEKEVFEARLRNDRATITRLTAIINATTVKTNRKIYPPEPWGQLTPELLKSKIWKDWSDQPNENQQP